MLSTRITHYRRCNTWCAAVPEWPFLNSDVSGMIRAVPICPPRWKAMSLPHDAVQSGGGAALWLNVEAKSRLVSHVLTVFYIWAWGEEVLGKIDAAERSNVRNRCSTDLDPQNAASAPDDLQGSWTAQCYCGKNALTRIFLNQRFKADFNLTVARTTKNCLDVMLCWLFRIKVQLYHKDIIW